MSADGTGWTLALAVDPDPALRERVLTPLQAYNHAALDPGTRGTLAVFVRDGAGEVVGGLWARFGYGMMFIELLTMGPARNAGLGRQAMAMAEAEARRLGLLGIWLDTFTFQAPGFYEKLGFTECGRIRDYPPGHDRIFYVKRFD